MTRTTLWLIALFALIAAACVAFGAYFSYVTLLNAHRGAIEARFGITAERLATTAERAASLGIALPAQATLAELLRREAEIEPAIASIDIVDAHDVVLFSSDPSRVGIAELATRNAVSRRISNDLGASVGRAVLRYKPEVLAAGASALGEDLTGIAVPTLGAAGLATVLIGLLLALALRRAARRAAEPASWPPAARAAFAALREAQAQAEAQAGAQAGGQPGSSAEAKARRGGGAPPGATPGITPEMGR